MTPEECKEDCQRIWIRVYDKMSEERKESLMRDLHQKAEGEDFWRGQPGGLTTNRGALPG